MVVGSKALLFNRSMKNLRFRKDFFTSYNVETIFNLSALRHGLFAHAAGPSAAVIFRKSKPKLDGTIAYCSPKPSHTFQDNLLFTIEPEDIAHIPYDEAVDSETIWKVSMWATPRDYELVRRLSKMQTLEKVADRRGWTHSIGYQLGKRDKTVEEFRGMKFLEANALTRYAIEQDTLRTLSEIKFERPRLEKKAIYKSPHLLIKRSPQRGTGLVSAVLTQDALVPLRIVGIHGEKKDLRDLISISAAVNSDILLYYALMTSGSLMIERDELIQEEVMHLPIPEEVFRSSVVLNPERLAENPALIASETERMFKAYSITPSERVLIEDAVRYTLNFFWYTKGSLALMTAEESQVKAYADFLCRTLNNSFSPSGRVFDGVYYSTKAPLRLVSIELVPAGSSRHPVIRRVSDRDDVEKILTSLDHELIDKQSESVYVRRHLRRYTQNSVHIVKPNQRRYWSQSAALLDADKIFSEIVESLKVDT
jgi:hypothetical protein